jgi:hypothetical protein
MRWFSWCGPTPAITATPAIFRGKTPILTTARPIALGAVLDYTDSINPFVHISFLKGV